MDKNLQGVVATAGSTYDPFHGNKEGAQAQDRKPISDSIAHANAIGLGGNKDTQPPPKQESMASDERVLDSIVGASAQAESVTARGIPEVKPEVVAAPGSPASQKATQPAVAAGESSPAKEQRVSDRMRQIKKDVFVDVFDVIRAFGVTCPAQMAVISDLLMAAPKDLEDRYLMLLESQDNLERAIELMGDEMGIQASLK
ncbi:hypothetical protein [Marinobacterium sp. BA1]|uniref:hypothetical protein n=1 Tax=Marinobacterium sp. BA1 TaxID=3138931 RepID=UPI0032E74DE2